MLVAALQAPLAAASQRSPLGGRAGAAEGGGCSGLGSIAEMRARCRRQEEEALQQTTWPIVNLEKKKLGLNNGGVTGGDIKSNTPKL